MRMLPSSSEISFCLLTQQGSRICPKGAGDRGQIHEDMQTHEAVLQPVFHV